MSYICNNCPPGDNDAESIYDGICGKCGALNSLQEVEDEDGM